MAIDHLHALPPGTRFEEYRLDAVLGAGGFGITYRAYDANLDKFVAIKEYLPSEFATRTAASTVAPKSSTDVRDYRWGLSRFLDEARTLARFDHAHLNKVHRFFESNGTAYMVLEYIEGETLADRLTRERRLPEDTLVRLLEEVLSGLAVVHDAGYVHRDIKPGNLMLRAEDGGAVVLDFGAARQAVGRRSQRLTTILTPGYAPIEQYDSKADDVGPWSDIYALGMVAYRCVSGVSDSDLPDAVTRGRVQRKGVVDITPAVKASKGEFSPRLLEAIDWALRVNEDERPQGLTEWQVALAGGSRSRKRTVKPLGKPATRSATASPRREGMRWTSTVLIVVAAILVGAGGWLGWQMYRGVPGYNVDGLVTALMSQPETQPGSQIQIEAEADTRAEVIQTKVGTGPQADSVPETVPATADVETPVKVDSIEAKAALLSPDAQDSASVDETGPTVPQTNGSVPSAEDDEVIRSLAAATADLKARRLTSPAGNNAWEKYQRVLSLSPAHPEAVAGMERVIGSYMELFGTAVEEEDFDKAGGYLTKIRELHPDSLVLEEGERRLNEASQARTDRLAEKEQQRVAAKMKDLANEMVAIAGGNFRMGDFSAEGSDSERPVHTVTVPSFKLGKYEVTFAQWDTCVADGGCNGYRPDDEGWGRGNRPVVNISWDDAQGFINWLNNKTDGKYRLPTEAEWEYAARARSTTNYSWGNEIDNNQANCVSNNCSDVWDYTAPVGSFAANAWGLHDMHGNVYEWVQDCYNDNYVGAPSDGSAWERENCSRRVGRGGAWNIDSQFLRSASRGRSTSSNRASFLGFRLAQDQ